MGCARWPTFFTLHQVYSIMEPSRQERIQALREALADHPVALATLFGSTATGETHHWSDVDVAIKFADDFPREQRSAELDRITYSVMDATGSNRVDVVDLDTVGLAVGLEAVSAGILCCGEESERADLESRFRVKKFDFEPIKAEWRAAQKQRIEDGSFGSR